MNENLFAMLEKSRLFSPYPHGPVAKVNVSAMDNYKFFLSNCFYEDGTDPLGYFKGKVGHFLKRYVNDWAEITAKKDRKFSWKEHSKEVFNLFGQFDWGKIYNHVISGENYVDLKIVASGSKIRITRFGNMLAFNVLCLSNSDKEHRSGHRAVVAWCRTPDSGNNQGVYEIVNKVEIFLSIPGENRVNREYVYNFSELYERLAKAAPWAEWIFDSAQMVENYRNNLCDKLIIGKYCGFDIHAGLIHDNNDQSKLQSQEIKIWRSGNVKKESAHEFRFSNGEDLRLSLVMRSSLPKHIFKEYDKKFDFARFKLSEAAAVICAQLCAMQLNQYRQSREAIGD
jgi:hypothetical protein